VLRGGYNIGFAVPHTMLYNCVIVISISLFNAAIPQRKGFRKDCLNQDKNTHAKVITFSNSASNDPDRLIFLYRFFAPFTIKQHIPLKFFFIIHRVKDWL
jgi:hypothetical protein